MAAHNAGELIVTVNTLMGRARYPLSLFGQFSLSPRDMVKFMGSDCLSQPESISKHTLIIEIRLVFPVLIILKFKPVKKNRIRGYCLNFWAETVPET